MQKKSIKTNSFLKLNPNIVVTHADKTKATVLLNKRDYVDNMLVNLSDETTYKVDKDPSDMLNKKRHKFYEKI